MKGFERIVLLDNGSLRPDAAMALRSLASQLSGRLGRTVDPVSLLHSSKIDPERLGGVPADTWKRYLKRARDAGEDRILVAPLFFGPSSAVVDYLPQVTSEVLGPESCRVALAKCLVDTRAESDDGVAALLAELVEQTMSVSGIGAGTKALLVDHGSPLVEVTRCRDLVARQMAGILGGLVDGVQPCSMERREGAEYDFNEPTLEAALSQLDAAKHPDLIISLMFFLPGRHAGAGGDVESIVRNSAWFAAGGRPHFCPLASASPRLVDLLEKRVREASK